MENYLTKQHALNARKCIACEDPMDGAYVVLTLKSKKRTSHYPVCSVQCQLILQQLFDDVVQRQKK